MQVRQLPLLQVALATHSVHHLQVLAARHLGDEVQEVVRLPVEAQAVQAPQGKGRVADPGVAVVPVALAAGRLGQRGGGGRHHRPGGRVGQALQRQRRALQVGPPRMVREVAARQPVLPVMRGPHQPAVGVVEGARRRRAAPGQGHEAALALLEHGAGDGARALEADVEVAGQRQLLLGAGARAGALVIARLGIRPRAEGAAVVEHRLAIHDQLDRSVHAAHRAQQDVLGVVVGGRAALGARPLLLLVPRADQQHVAHDDPAGAGPPACLQHVGAGQVAPRGGHLHVGRPEAEATGVAVQDGAEHAGRVDPRHAQPLDVARRRNQSGRLAIGQEAELGDGREGRAGVPGATGRSHGAHRFHPTVALHAMPPVRVVCVTTPPRHAPAPNGQIRLRCYTPADARRTREGGDHRRRRPDRLRAGLPHRLR